MSFFKDEMTLPVLLTVAAVLMFAVMMLYGFNNGKFDFLENKNQKQKFNQVAVIPTEEPKIIRTDYTEVARKTLDWIDKQRNQEGWYILARSCNYQNKTCDEIWDCDEGNKDGLIDTWVRLNFYEQKKYKNDLEIVKKDINNFFEKYPNGVDNALWICKITYEMAQSKYLNKATKNKLEKICFGSPIPEIILGRDEYFKRLGKVSENLKKDDLVWKKWERYSLGIRGVDNYFGLASDLVYQNLWKKDEKRLVEAKKYFESAKEIIGQMGDVVGPEDECLVGLGAIDIYEFGGKDINYLKYAKDKYMTFFDEKGNIKKYRTTICGLFSKRLYLVLNDKTFYDETEKNNRMLVDGLWDGDGSLAKTVNDNGFYMASVGGGGFPIKNVVENGLMVELIRN